VDGVLCALWGGRSAQLEAPPPLDETGDTQLLLALFGGSYEMLGSSFLVFPRLYSFVPGANGQR
jgi:hypothetical protein